jgi:UDP-glucose 4-epimerase
VTILVVGGAGYIGSVTVEQLIAAGKPVVVLDNLSRGHRAAVLPQAQFIRGDMADKKLIVDILTQYHCSAVMHFSALSLVAESMQKPLEYYHNNIKNSITLVESMLECDVRKMIFSSSAAVYGEPESVPILETHPTRPTNPYGQTKLIFEEFLDNCGQAYGLKYVSLRYFNAAGATDRLGEDHNPETHLIPLVLKVAAGQKQYIKVFGDDYPTTDGSCIRDYIHVRDLADAHLLALEYLDKQQRSEIYNLGNGNGFSVFEVIRIAEQVTGRKIATTMSPRRPGDPAILVASAKRISEELGWRASCPGLPEIIESAWKWLLKHPDGYPKE